MTLHQAAKALDDLAEKTSNFADRVAGARASKAVDRALTPIRSLIPVGCTRDHGHDEQCA